MAEIRNSYIEIDSLLTDALSVYAGLIDSSVSQWDCFIDVSQLFMCCLVALCCIFNRFYNCYKCPDGTDGTIKASIHSLNCLSGSGSQETRLPSQHILVQPWQVTGPAQDYSKGTELTKNILNITSQQDHHHVFCKYICSFWKTLKHLNDSSNLV